MKQIMDCPSCKSKAGFYRIGWARVKKSYNPEGRLTDFYGKTVKPGKIFKCSNCKKIITKCIMKGEE